MWLLVLCSSWELFWTIHSNMMKQFKLLWENYFENSWEFYSDGFKKLVQHWQHLKQENMEKWGAKTKYTLWAIFCIFFPFNTLPGRKDIQTQKHYFRNNLRNYKGNTTELFMLLLNFNYSILKNLFSWWLCIKWREHMEKWGKETNYTFWATFFVLFHFDTLSLRKDTKKKVLLPSEQPS